MKLYIMSDTLTVVKSLCTVQKEKETGVSGASKLIVMIFFSFFFFFFYSFSFTVVLDANGLRRHELPEGDDAGYSLSCS